MSKVYVVVRVRGETHVKKTIADSLKTLGLTRKNHCTLIVENESTQGLLQKIKDYVTWGEANEGTVGSLLAKRGRVSIAKPLSDDFVKENSAYPDIKSFALALSKGEATMVSVKGLKNYFRLNPPKKGFERGGIKYPFSVGGALGYRGEKINDLVGRMV
ncbi:MAG: 50S ribosomal protein L30 [Candidatus Altiarchaeota archaeon]|nr:50S ribosomal protein L30 [Candidatus Altiarchaeota archaeon]